jgi:hypothetical protein
VAESDRTDHRDTFVRVRDGDQWSEFVPVKDFNSAMSMLVAFVSIELKFEAPRKMLQRAMTTKVTSFEFDNLRQQQVLSKLVLAASLDPCIYPGEL